MRIERTPEDDARINALRDRFQRDHPSLDDLVSSGAFGPPINQGDYSQPRTKQSFRGDAPVRDDRGIAGRQSVFARTASIAASSAPATVCDPS